MPVTWPRYRATEIERRATLVTGPAVEPVSVADAKDHLRVTGSDEDALIASLIVGARQHVERVTGRQLITATWELKLDRFPDYDDEPIELPSPPLLSVVSVTYRDTADAPQTWASSEYVVDAPVGPYALTGRIYPAFEKEYPDTVDRADAVTIQFTAGYGTTAESVPQAIRQALLLIVGHWFENRETVNIGNITTELPFAAEALLGSFTRLAWLVR